MKTVKAAPKAAALMEGIRDFGYSLGAALADIIDNAIAARASVVNVETTVVGESPFVAIIDDGDGMSEAELLAAMVLGSQDPRIPREQGDLGRFGLGLKTASFSQCRRMTVVTRSKNKTSAARWDLDLVSATDDWLLEIPEADEISAFSKKIVGAHGTAVVWEQLDRLLGDEPDDAARAAATDTINTAILHLSLVFHRFLKGEAGLPKVRIVVNGRDLEPFDPFYTAHPATIKSPVELIHISHDVVRVQAFTLPHHSKVSRRIWEKNAGPEGYLKNQGFYVYRSGRLIIHGTWFRLARQTPNTQLCRVQIDLPNSLDADWQLDVKKASAQPPRIVRDRLRTLIENLGAPSRRVYDHRGRRLVEANPLPVWARLQKEGSITYAVNREHPSIARAIETGNTKDIETAISLVESSLPLDPLLADLGNTPNEVTNAEMPYDELRTAVSDVLELFRESPDTADAVLTIGEPFRSHPELTQKIRAELEKAA